MIGFGERQNDIEPLGCPHTFSAAFVANQTGEDVERSVGVSR